MFAAIIIVIFVCLFSVFTAGCYSCNTRHSVRYVRISRPFVFWKPLQVTCLVSHAFNSVIQICMHVWRAPGISIHCVQKKRGEFGSRSWGGIFSGVSFCNSSMVARVLFSCLSTFYLSSCYFSQRRVISEAPMSRVPSVSFPPVRLTFSTYLPSRDILPW